VNESIEALVGAVDSVAESIAPSILDFPDGRWTVSESLQRIADAITPNIAGGPDKTGGHIESLTESVMGVTAGLCKIADAISDLASAVRERQAS